MPGAKPPRSVTTFLRRYAPELRVGNYEATCCLPASGDQAIP